VVASVDDVRLMDDDRWPVVDSWRRCDVHSWHVVSCVDDWNRWADVDSWYVRPHVNGWHVSRDVDVGDMWSDVHSGYVRSHVDWWVMWSDVDWWGVWSNMYAGWEWMPSVVLSFLSRLFFVIVRGGLTFN